MHLQWRPRFNPWVGKIPWRREWLPTLVFWPGEFHRLYIYIYSWKESDRTEQLSLSFLLQKKLLSDGKHTHQQFFGSSVLVEYFYDLAVQLSSLERLSLNNVWHGATYQKQIIYFIILNFKTFSVQLSPSSFWKTTKGNSSDKEGVAAVESGLLVAIRAG